MVITFDAVYSGGVLRPSRPLALREGERVEVTLTSTETPATDDDVARRLKSAKSVAEWVEATRLLPADDGGYDILDALNQNRVSRFAGSLYCDLVRPNADARSACNDSART